MMEYFKYQDFIICMRLKRSISNCRQIEAYSPIYIITSISNEHNMSIFYITYIRI